MKNLINTAVNSASGRKQGKFTITSDLPHKKISRSVSYSHTSESFLDELNISLKSFELDLNENTKTSKESIHDCDLNTFTQAETQKSQKQSNLQRLKSWNSEVSKRFRGFEDHLPSSEEILASFQQQLRHNKHKRTKSDVTGQWKGIGYTVPNKITTSTTNTSGKIQKFGSDLRKISREHLPAPLRKFSTVTRKISDSSPNTSELPVEYIDFSACYSPEEMKTWGQVIDKLATTIRNTNSTAHRTYSSLSGTLNTTAKRYISNHKRRKSYDCNNTRRNEESDVFTRENDVIRDSFDCKDNSENDLDISLSRENIDQDLADGGISFSSNVWYYGELDIENSSEEDDISDRTLSGNIVVRVDCHGDVVYSITYKMADETFVGTFPLENGRYCLDFNDPKQPRFACVKFLLAYLIEQNYLHRVTFNWLIENSDIL